MTPNDSDTIMAQNWFCPGCGDEIDAGEDVQPWSCGYCGAEMQPQTQKREYVSREVLEVLADEWEGNKFYAAGEDYAQELREVIENHDG